MWGSIDSSTTLHPCWSSSIKLPQYLRLRSSLHASARLPPNILKQILALLYTSPHTLYISHPRRVLQLLHDVVHLSAEVLELAVAKASREGLCVACLLTVGEVGRWVKEWVILSIINKASCRKSRSQ